MNTTLRLTIMAALICIGHPSGWAQSGLQQARSSLTDDQLAAVQTLESTIDQAAAKELSPGLGVALVGRDGAIWARTYGFADVEQQRQVTLDTPFMLASVTKTFIAAAMATEREAGRLALDQPINEILPFAVQHPRVPAAPIRVRHLAAHTSGIRDHERVFEGSYQPGDPSIAMDEWIASYLVRGGTRYRKKKNFTKLAPGKAYEYSNIAAALGAVVVEQTSGLSYRTLLKERFFDPLGMRNTAFNISDFGPDTLAVPYEFKKKSGFVRRAHYGYPTYADGQLRSSVNDLAKYLAMLLGRGEFDGRRILQPESVDWIEQKLHPDRGESQTTAQAVYWHLRFDDRFLGHSGGDWGVSTFVFYDRERRMGAIILMNAWADSTDELMVACLQSLTVAMRPFEKK